jgi:hypothetical protein
MICAKSSSNIKLTERRVRSKHTTLILILVAASALAASPRPPTRPIEVGRDGPLIAYDDGTVLDTITNLNAIVIQGDVQHGLWQR